jgi:DNA ligase (NAD+)
VAFGEDSGDTDVQDAPPYRPPTSCPSCGSATRASPLIETRASPGSAAVLRCVGGLRCPAQAVERIAHFVSRDALDVSGLAKTQIAAMLAEGVVTSPADLFTLRARFDRGDAAATETRDAAASAIPARWLYASGARAGTLKRSATKLFDALDDVKARGVPLRRFLFALGIRGVGRETAAALAKTFGTLEAFREAASSEAARERIEGNDDFKIDATSRLTSIDGVGPAVAATVGEFFAEPANVAALDATLANGVRVLPDDDDDASKAFRDETRNVDAAAFEGLRVVVTGAVPGMTRAEALAAVARAGGVAQKAVSGKTDVLVAGDGAGRRKAEAAAERGARVIDARTFLETLFPDASDARE